VILGIGVASAVFGIVRQTVQHEPGFVLPRTMPGIGYGQFVNKNHFALLMEMTLGLGVGIGLLRSFNRDRMMVYVALLLPVWTALVLSNSRGGILSMLAQVVVAGLLLMRRWDFKAARGGGIRVMRNAMLLLLVTMIAAGTIWVGGDRLVSSFSQAPTDFTEKAADQRSGVSRIEIWQATWKMFTAHPMLGVGLGGYWVAITAYHDASGVSTPQEAHNDYLELLSSGGVVGLAIGAWFGVALFRRVRVNVRSDNHFQRSVCLAALLGIAGVAVHSLVDFGLHLLVNAVVFLVLIMLATKRIPVES
jgi:O-antigen ligase